jgi:phosphoglycerate dehydrogenase-like enzyme
MHTVSVPTREILAALRPVDEVEYVLWDMTAAPDRDDIELAVVPYMSAPSLLSVVAGTGIGLLQSQSIGYDGVADFLPPGVRFCNAVGVHEASTAELALALTLASLRGIPEFVKAQESGRWIHNEYGALADRKVIVIGQGGVGRAIVERFRPFEVELERVASAARSDEDGPIRALSEVPGLLPEADVVVLAVPLNESTIGLIDDAFLGRMKPGSLLVNVARGAVVDTDALLAHTTSGRIRAAIDVTDPEPLPAGHPLWQAPGVLISPHVGGHTSAMIPRVAKLVRRQSQRLVDGELPINLVLAS